MSITDYPPEARSVRRDRTRRARIADRLAADQTLTMTAKAVCAELLRYSDQTAKAVCPSNETVADRLGICERTVQNATLELEQAGIIKKCLRPISASRNATNLYYFYSPPPISALPDHREGQRRRLRLRTGEAHSKNPCSDRVNLDASEPKSSLTSTPGRPGLKSLPARQPGYRGSFSTRKARPGPAVPSRWSEKRPIPAAWLLIDDEELRAELQAEADAEAISA